MNFDGDGFDRMIDCDDQNPDLQRLDVDEDGLSTCDGDCDDFDQYDSGHRSRWRWLFMFVGL